MHIVYVNHANFRGNSGIHIFPLANIMVKRGHKVTVFVPDDPSSVEMHMGEYIFDVRRFDDNGRLPNYGGMIIHAWTPRERTRKQTCKLAKEYNVPYIIHLEDNEEKIVEDALGQPFSYLERKSTRKLDKLIPEHLSHPHRYKNFLDHASGATCIIESLKHFVPKSIPVAFFWPACEEEMFNIPEYPVLDVRKKLGIPKDVLVLAYLGNMHSSNQYDVSALYKAIGILNDQGRYVRLIRTGHNSIPFLMGANNVENKNTIELGDCCISDALGYLSASDILVQPGIMNEFNKYRFPSKIPMFLASGRPVVLPNVNIGKHLTNGVNCIKLVKGDPEELAQKIAFLQDNPLLSRIIGQKGRNFAKKHFCWQKSAEKLIGFYQNVLDSYSNV